MQNFARKKLVSYLENKLHTKVAIGKFTLSFPKSIVLENVYFEDQKKDTLLSGGKIQVDISLLKLIKSEVEINYVGLKNITTKIYRTGSDTSFNYQYILTAFAGKSSSQKDTSSGMKINVDKIDLDNINAIFKDNQTGIDFFVGLGKFTTAFKKFDPDKMIFSLPQIALSNVTGHMFQNKPLMEVKPAQQRESESNKPFNLALNLKNIDFTNIKFDYRNDVSVMSANLNLGQLSTEVESIDLAKLNVKIKSVKLLNTNTSIILGKSVQTEIVKKEINKAVVAEVNNPWKILINNIDFVNNNIAFDDNNAPRQNSGIDYKHLKIDNFKLKGNNFVFTPNSDAGLIIDAGFKEKSGFNIKQLKTNFAYSDTGAALKDLFLQTDKTLIKDNIIIKYPSLAAVTKDVGKLYINANLSKTAIAVKDILLLAPQLKTNLKGNENAVVLLNSRVIGYVNNLTIPTFEVSGIGNTNISMSGNIKGLPNIKNTVYDLNINSFKTTKNDIVKFIPPGTIPNTIRLPETMKVSGSFKGLATNFITDIALQTDRGNATIKGFLNSGNETYNIKGTLNNVAVGFLTKQDSIVGNATMQYAVKGKGFKPATMNTNANAQVSSIFLKGYNYHNINLTAGVHSGFTVIDAAIADKSIALHLKGEAMIDDKFATNIKMKLLLDSILLKPLGFAATDIRVHANMEADIPDADLNRPKGNVQINELVVVNEGQRYKADSITLTAKTTDSGKIISLNSQIATAVLKGKYNLKTISSGAMQLVNKYYNIGIKDSLISKDQWNLTAAIIPDSLLFVFVPALAGTDTIRINANFDGATEKLNFVVNAPKVQAGTQILDSLTISASNSKDQFNYAATVKTAGSKSFQLQKTSLTGFVAQNSTTTKLNIKDSDGDDKYQISATIKQQKDGEITAHILDSLILDNDKWAVNTGNLLKYNKNGIIVHQFGINKDGQSLLVASKTDNETAPIELILKDFKIKTLTNLAERDSLLINGSINGNIVVKDALKSPVFTADIKVDTLTYNTDTVGNIAIKVDNETANAYNTDIAITGNENDVKLAGKYFTGEGKMDLKLLVNNLNMTSLKPFTFGALTQADGSLKGSVNFQGTTAAPDIHGVLHFEKSNITPAATGVKLHLSKESITVETHDLIKFDQFTLLDSAGKKAILDGTISTNDFKSFEFNLNLAASDFQVLNIAKKQNQLYYGRLNMDADIDVTGTLTAPSINADLKINKKTDITFILPSSNPEIENREGVVQFVDIYGAKKDSLFKAALDTLIQYPKLAGMDITGTLQSDTAAQINLVIDERSNDALKIRGKANLSGGVDKSGKISLTGDYLLQAGSYQLTLSLLKRQFLITPGSVITWTGDPMSANVNITAKYIANTQPINLLQSELGNASSAEQGKYKGKLPFEVLLKMKGELLKPIITFDIVLPDALQSSWTDVTTKLEQIRRDDAELNKQVFALLLLGRFVQENPLQNGAEGTSLASTAKSSVSKLLAEQLNNLAGSLVQGVNLNFGVNTDDDYSSGTRTSRTDLTVGVSKSLLNDRLRVSVGSNFELEGPANTNENASNIAGDVAVDYLLSKDGRYALRAYRKNEYEGVVEGQVVESGVSFIFTFDFNEFKQIFNRKTAEQKEKELQLQQKAKQVLEMINKNKAKDTK